MDTVGTGLWSIVGRLSLSQRVLIGCYALYAIIAWGQFYRVCVPVVSLFP